MKKLFLFIALVISQLAIAQVQEGIIEYEFKVNMHKGLGKDQENMKSMIPEFRTSKNRLYFTPTESFYTNIEEDPEDVNTTAGGANVQMRFTRPQLDLYRNFETSKFVTLTDFAGKKFRIEDSLTTNPWKFVDETRKIAGYDCKKATFYNEDAKQEVVAWYTEALISPAGPQNFYGLPGLILQADLNDGTTMITASKIELKKLTNEIKVPSGGKKVSAKEFKKIRDDYMKEMGIQGGSGPRIMIRTN
ncbi:GLPGLI family protein [Emticicia sp. BO119]|uniref:GLPGLI family protein n=1 Tax=Emticicia sp. BO119 TaxID=2757768 RepID=UPI0015F04A81|nr:GLPGLI family protein [Emticicia sp. BO119]MBA4852146.1 GLPGLI family protein [Emticicia sp. BO119]